jgi:hypothetical protein
MDAEAVTGEALDRHNDEGGRWNRLEGEKTILSLIICLMVNSKCQ